MTSPDMMLPKLSLVYLQVMLLGRRLGGINSLTICLLLLALSAGGWHQHAVQQQTRLAAQALLDAQHPLHTGGSEVMSSSLPVPVNQNRLDDFYALLGDEAYVEQQVNTLFALANKNSLSLNQGQYQSAYDKEGAFFTYQVTLPVKAPYHAIRRFCEQALVAIPFASLDDISFQRDSIGSPAPEAAIRFTFYLRDWKASPSDGRIRSALTSTERTR